MGKKKQERREATGVKKASIIDKLKFMQVDKPDHEKKAAEPAPPAVDVKDLPVFFRKVHKICKHNLEEVEKKRREEEEYFEKINLEQNFTRQTFSWLLMPLSIHYAWNSTFEIKNHSLIAMNKQR